MTGFIVFFAIFVIVLLIIMIIIISLLKRKNDDSNMDIDEDLEDSYDNSNLLTGERINKRHKY